MTIPYIDEIIDSITYSRFLIKFKAFEEITFPESFKGEAYRDCFNEAFMQLVCSFKNKSDCTGCTKRFDCSYYKLSTNELTFPHPFFGKKTFPPKCYIINPDYNPSKQISHGEFFQFELILLGETIAKYTPLLIPIIRRMGEIGIGNGRRKFEPVALEFYNESGKYEPLPAIGLPAIHKLSNLHVMPISNQILLDFETPVRFLSGGEEMASEPSFDEFIKRLYIRLGDLAFLYCNFKKTDYEQHSNIITTQAKCVQNSLRRVGFRSFSNKKKEPFEKAQKHYKGHVGRITFNGEITPLLKLLVAGEIVHVGSTATFGLGKYRIINDE